jgi:hypothetical protein
MSDDPAVILHNLTRKCTRETANATCGSTLLDEFDDSTSLDDFGQYRRRLQKTLDTLLSLDDALRNLLSDEYEKNIQVREQHIDRAKRTIQKASR